MVLAVRVKTRSPENIALQVYDHRKPNTFYTRRSGTVAPKNGQKEGQRLFYVRMPQSPDKAIVKVFNTKVGNKPKGIDKSFRVAEMKTLPLKAQVTCRLMKNPDVRNFVEFAQKFSERAGILSAGRSVYLSDNGKFRIDYLDQIINRKTKVPLKTPARISKDWGVIEISKKHFLTYTVPERMAILLHEFSHFYLNENIDDETEADLNALLIYLGLGYPRIDGHNVFLKVFRGTPTKTNVDRHKKLIAFIDNFEKIQFKPC